MHVSSSFLTLTYDERHLPKTKDGLSTLKKEDVQKFIRRLRKNVPNKIRYYCSGEYGDDFSRPHYHMCLFGEDFRSDRRYIGKSKKGSPQYSSDWLQYNWNKGYCTVGNLNFHSAQYCAKYCTKVRTGKGSDEWYQGREKESALISNKPGLGYEWFRKFKLDIYNTHKCILNNGKEVKIPRLYDTWLEREMAQKVGTADKKGRLWTNEEIEHGINKKRRFNDVNPDEFTPESLYRKRIYHETIEKSNERNLQ